MHSIIASLAAFVAAATLLTITPGLDTALVLRTAAAEGARKAALAGLGIAVGCMIWAAIVAVGLGALLAASQMLYAALRWIGAAYLIWLGVTMLRQPPRTFSPQRADATGTASFMKGALTNLLNPKVGIFYVSFLPQFVPANAPVAAFILLLGFIHVCLGMAWFLFLIVATRPLTRALQDPRLIQALDRGTGSLFILFGAGLILESARK